MHLLRKFECHLRATGTPPTCFEREAAGDPRLVGDLRRGREPRPGITMRILAYIDARGNPAVSGIAGGLVRALAAKAGTSVQAEVSSEPWQSANFRAKGTASR